MLTERARRILEERAFLADPVEDARALLREMLGSAATRATAASAPCASPPSAR